MSIHITDFGDALVRVFGGLFHGPEEPPVEMTEDRLLLVQCRRSGQIPDAAWAEHVAADPALARLAERPR